MKKISILFVSFIAFISLPIVLSCEDINYSVSYLGKDDEGCFTGLTFNLYKNNCNVSCFKDFDIITFQTNTDYFRSFNVTRYSAQISNPFIVVINSLNCTADRQVYEFYADLDGDKNCSFSFRLEEEYQSYLAKLAEQEARLAEEKRLWEESERQKQLFEEQQKRELESLNQQMPPTLPKINDTFETDVSIDGITIEAQTEGVIQETKADPVTDDSTFIMIIIGLVALIILTATLIVYIIIRK